MFTLRPNNFTHPPTQNCLGHLPQKNKVVTLLIETLLERFWALEESDAAPEEFTQEGQCQTIFRDGCTRDSSGRLCVPLLFHQAVSGDTFRGSRAVAEKRFEHLEKKLANNPRLQRLYCDFMSEYLTLGHMSPAKSEGDYFIPHHAVYRPTDIDPKIRVVFDASATLYSGVSSNDCLLPGPKLQRDIVDVLLLYRVHRFAFTTDISKMYRQVSVSPLHRRYQQILWRSSPEQMLQAYELNTVIYGLYCIKPTWMISARAVTRGFCDALSTGYAAVVYLRVIDLSGNPIVLLFGAQSKIAPVKSTTIPRLELCATLLLARLTVTLSLKLHITDVHAWSDSTTVLGWLKHPHESFKVFVSNRIFKIQSLVPTCQWHYIKSAFSSADCGSWGLTQSDFIKHDLYFNGPSCLSLPPQQWDQYIPINIADQLPEFKVQSAKVLIVQEEKLECQGEPTSKATPVQNVSCRFCVLHGTRGSSRVCIRHEHRGLYSCVT
ncbi:hypothetical protein QTP88_026748 [Uroleucon formosanum]